MTDSAAKTALDHAWYLVRRGEVSDARFWASEAANFDPGLEEAWLILAALSNPDDSFEYLRKALEINPHSRRGKRGVGWAEAKTGRLFVDFLSTFTKISTPTYEPEIHEPGPSMDYSAFVDSLEPYHEDIYQPETTKPKPQFSVPTESPPPTPPPPTLTISPPMIIRRRRPRRPPPVPVNPWSVLLPYTVSFVIFFFFASIWLLSGLPNVMAQSLEPTLSTEYLVNQYLTANPIQTQTLEPTETLLPSKTPTKIPTFTPTFTPQPTGTPIPITPTPNDSVSLPIQFGDISAETLADGRWIEVDLNNQMVRAYQGDEIVKEFLVSTGTAAHPTVKGNFHVYVKYRYADMRGPGYYLTNVPFTMYFYQSYGLHGTYWHHNFGTPMSHGCVNLQTDDAAWLYKWASVGTLVHVH